MTYAFKIGHSLAKYHLNRKKVLTSWASHYFNSTFNFLIKLKSREKQKQLNSSSPDLNQYCKEQSEM